MPSSECPSATPMLRWVVESVRSRCSREVVKVRCSTSSKPSDSSRLASAFSNRIGLTLWGMVEDPIEPAGAPCVKYPCEMYVHVSVHRLCSTRLYRWTSAYSSACQSWGSICVVSGFQVRPSPSTKTRDTACQSTSGAAAWCAA